MASPVTTTARGAPDAPRVIADVSPRRDVSRRRQTPVAPALLVSGWAAIGFGAALRHGTYTGGAVSLVTLGTGLLLVAALVGADTGGTHNRLLALVAAVSVLGALAYPGAIYASGTAWELSRLLTVLAAAAVSVTLATHIGDARAVGAGAIVVMGVAGIALVVSSPRPPIDVWYMLQAAAHGLSHGRNLYTVHWTSRVAHQQSNGFAYLPGAAVVLWPFQAAFGDVRYGLLAAMIGTSLVLLRARGRSDTGALAPLVVLYPCALFGLEQSWVDPIVLLALCVAVYAVQRGHTSWAVAAFAVCLVCKQQAWLLVPLVCSWRGFGWRRSALSVGGALAFMAPWIATAPSAFYHWAIRYNLDLPPRRDSLSLFHTVASIGWRPGIGVVVLITVTVIVLVARRLPQSGCGFLMGSAAVMASFNLVNKQSFFNEWALAAGLALAAMVFGGAPAESGPVENEASDATVGDGVI